MKKKIIAGGLALILLIGVVLFNLPTPVDNIIAPARVVAAPVPREGYLLVPIMQGISGVDTASTFTLTSPYSQADMPVITIDGQPEPLIERTGDNEFLITPYGTLQANSLHIFRLSRDGLSDITWTFQTTVRFQVVSTLPANHSTNVPTDTGIEITFTSPDHTDIEEYFSIYPEVEGRFINRGATAIFMPLNSLAPEQIYTVTIQAGIALPGTNEVLEADHVFAFETAATGRSDDDWFWSSFRFANRYSEFPSFEPPQLNFMRDGDSRTFSQVNVRVYPLGGRIEATRAVRQLTNAPWWARFAWENSLIDTSGMNPVFTFDFTDRQGEADAWVETMVLPETLPPGFYLVSAQTEDAIDQSILQITDLGVQIVADEGQALLWVNDMTTGQPAIGATVSYRGANFTTSGDGIAIVNRPLEQDHTLTVVAADGKEVTLFFFESHFGHRGWGWGASADENYWAVLQLDRTLFQRSDTLYFWGFVQNRTSGSDIRSLNVTVTQSWSWWDTGSRDILHRQTALVSNGAYTGNIQLPHLDPGFYSLTIRHGDTIVGSTFFSVEDYVTPPYQFLISSDRQAIFADEEVTFTARGEFFEGTPVADLEINYGFWGWAFRDIAGGRGVTGTDGEFTVSARPVPTTGEWAPQGRSHLELWAEATLPEVGPTFRTHTVDVFVNDIEVQPRASRVGADANISVNVNNITLDRINDGTAEDWADFLCTPVAGQQLDVRIYRVYWVPIRDGEFYCHIQRRVVPRYRHDRREETIDRFTLTTDANGEVSHDFTVPNRDYESYHAYITTTDGNGRTIGHRLFIGRDWSDFMWRTWDNSLFLYSPHEWDHTYDIGDEVTLTVKQGLEVVDSGSFLFVMMQNGILYYQVGTGNPFTFTFSEEHVPNVTVYAYYFNGHTYHSGWGMRQWLRFNTQNRALQISVEADRDSYRPGDTSSLRVTVTDMDGNPRPANVNISVVDEALLALQDNHINTLEALYRSVGDGLLFARATHSSFESDGTNWGGMRSGMAMGLTGAAPESAEYAADDASYGGSGPSVRTVFEDTAIFMSQQTNAAGVANLSFQLPDNITSWRVTVSAISPDLYAGNTVEDIIVTIPMFVHYAFASTFLVGDVPTIGVNAYGVELTGNETVNFEIWDENNPDQIRRASGLAFERVNIPLWEMSETGTHGLIVQATVEGSAQLADALRHEYQVVRTHRLIDNAVFYENVSTSTVFDVGTQGLTNITFTDRGRGQFLMDLMKMRHVPGARLEGLTARREAERLITAHFPDIELWHWDNQPFEPRNYQRPDGGLAIFPYAESCLEMTVRLIPFLWEDINEHALRNYLYDVFEGDNPENKMLALYGLALLGEPVLLDLHAYASITDLSVRDVAFIALGFAQLGETVIAENMYTERILPHLQQVAPLYRAHENLGRDSILEATSTIAMLATNLGMPQTEGLRQYTARERTCDLTIMIERLTVISHEIDSLNPTPASIAYTLFGEEFTRDLSDGWGWGHTLRIPTQNMNRFSITNVIGDVGAVSIRQVPLEEVQIVDNDITISRAFLREGGSAVEGAFRQDELVRVQITIDYSAKSIHGSYVITDFLPAGLAFVRGSARFRDPVYGSGWVHARQDGQRVIFFDFNNRFDGMRVYYYYARVITPGTFTAQGPIVQNMGARAYLTVGSDATVVVE
ncbi:MAG: Ig-like domain-containing protein [Defluviitaleaceae bacterium]|nr:Ig-like domain-containing protein [Defluviitaleaceae bacterium]